MVCIYFLKYQCKVHPGWSLFREIVYIKLLSEEFQELFLFQHDKMYQDSVNFVIIKLNYSPFLDLRLCSAGPGRLDDQWQIVSGGTVA